MSSLQEVILHTTGNYSGTLTTFVNFYSYRKLRRFRNIYSEFDNIHIDGIALQLIFNFFYGSHLPRISFDFTSIADDIFYLAEVEKKSIFFVGSKNNEISNAVARIRLRYPKLIISGFRHGYFASDKEYYDAIKSISDMNPDIIIAGMGTPLQEMLLIDIKKTMWKGSGFTCGGFLHQTAIKSMYYPKWINKLNLRWLYRICDEPYLYKRYMIDYSIGLFLFIKDYFTSKRKYEKSSVYRN